MKIELLKGVKYYQDEDPNIRLSNLNKDEQDGLNELREAVKSKQSVVMQTDKSKKFLINIHDNYRKDMEKHIEKDKIVDTK